MTKTIINAKNAPAAVGPYVHAVKVGDFLFTSGQIGLIPETGLLQEGIVAQTEQVLKNLGAVLEEAGLSYSDVIKTTVLPSSFNCFKNINISLPVFESRAPVGSSAKISDG